MSKAEESYKYALNKEKYDSDVVKAVDKKSLKKKDANTVNKIQDLMRKEREEQRNKKSRQVVTSENREDFMAKKLGLAKKEKPVYDEQDPPTEKYSVKYHNAKGVEEAEKHFDDEEKAKAYMEKGKSLDKVGGKYSMTKIMVK
jgi:hypothetical protein